jgi:tetratricopeptide (TPR) repeat protein
MRTSFSVFPSFFLVAIVWFTPLFLGASETLASGAPTDETTTPNGKISSNSQDNPCRTFSDTSNPDEAETNYVIYRNLVKTNEKEEAMKVWRKVYANSPAADGRRPTVYTDGVAFYSELIRQFPDRKQAYGDTILMLYQQARDCYPGDGYMAAIQAFDSYYTYEGLATKDEVFALFKESLEIDGPEKLQYFCINPMASLLVEQHREGKIEAEEAKTISDALMTRLEKGLAECEGRYCEAWKTIQSYTPDVLRYFETVRGFYDCNYYINQYYQDFLDNPTDCDVILTVFSRLKYGECLEGSPEFDAVSKAYAENCVVTVGPSTLKIAFDNLKDGEYDTAIENFLAASEETDDAEKKGRYLLYAAKVYYSHKRNFREARKYALRAAGANPSSGEPYMLIGTLYASSGPLCGPGTGFDSQIVTWPAIDKWQRAKAIEPALAAEANKYINRYSQYMPSKSDIFQRGINEGDKFYVACWIQESTRVRTPK